MKTIKERVSEIAREAKTNEETGLCEQIADIDRKLDFWVGGPFKKGAGTEDDYFRIEDASKHVLELLSQEEVPSIEVLQRCLDTLIALRNSLPDT